MCKIKKQAVALNSIQGFLKKRLKNNTKVEITVSRLVRKGGKSIVSETGKNPKQIKQPQLKPFSFVGRCDFQTMTLTSCF